MGIWKRRSKARARMEELSEALHAALDSAPIATMEELIALGKAHEAVRSRVFEELDTIIGDRSDDLVLCWWGLVAGELGREGLLRVLWGWGQCEGDAYIEAFIPTLTRHAVELLPDILWEIHVSEDTDRRQGLYDVLEGALVLGDEAVRERLRIFSLERWEAEKTAPEGPELLHWPLFFLHHLGDQLVRERLREARSLCRKGDLLDCELNDIERLLSGEDLLDQTREMVAETWKDTARNIENLFGDRKAP